jgi:hypothetical protein
MKGTIIRKFNERERELMEERLAMEKPPREPKGPWLGCLIVCIISGGLAYFFWGRTEALIFAGLSLLGMIIVAFLSRENIRWRKKRMEVEWKLIEALEDNRVEVARIEASEVVVEINEGCPQAYYFDVGGDLTLRLELGSLYWPAVDPGDGQAIYVAPDEDIWPNNHFEIVRTVKNDLWVGAFCLGEKLEPIRQINTIEEDPIAGKCESPVALFRGSLDDLLKTKGKEPVEVWL